MNPIDGIGQGKEGLTQKGNLPKLFWTDTINTDQATEKNFCSYKIKTVSRETLISSPPVLSAGIRRNRGTSFKELKQFLFMVLKKEGSSVNSIWRFATIGIKKI